MSNLLRLLTSDFVTKTVYPSLELLMDKKSTNTKTLKLFYAETFDEFGITIDSLKYYFVLSLLHKYLEEQGFQVDSHVIIADVASRLNKSSQEKRSVLDEQTNYRLKFLHKIIKIYDLPIQPILMSDVFTQDEFFKKYALVQKCVADETVAKEIFFHLEKTVLKNKITQEKQSGFQYSLEAVATSLLFDLKLGPPREIFYDQAAQIIIQHHNLPPLSSIYLQPTYPLGKDFSYFLTHPEVEEFGITPYKAGSNKLQDFRIILEKTHFTQTQKLLFESFESNNKLVIHPVFDMYLIADTARMFLKKEFDFPEYTLQLLNDIPQFKQKTFTHLNNYIFQPLKKGGICQ